MTKFNSIMIQLFSASFVFASDDLGKVNLDESENLALKRTESVENPKLPELVRKNAQFKRFSLKESAWSINTQRYGSMRRLTDASYLPSLAIKEKMPELKKKPTQHVQFLEANQIVTIPHEDNPKTLSKDFLKANVNVYNQVNLKRLLCHNRERFQYPESDYEDAFGDIDVSLSTRSSSTISDHNDPPLIPSLVPSSCSESSSTTKRTDILVGGIKEFLTPKIPPIDCLETREPLPLFQYNGNIYGDPLDSLSVSSSALSKEEDEDNEELTKETEAYVARLLRTYGTPANNVKHTPKKPVVPAVPKSDSPSFKRNQYGS
ncbi:MAG: hypothetical protein KBD31_01340 [Proteobacteria bacterium]|nr:hypothetical protein [Pseudomonadota bacterium]